MMGSLALGLAQEQLAGIAWAKSGKQEGGPDRQSDWSVWCSSPTACESRQQDKSLRYLMAHLSPQAYTSAVTPHISHGAKCPHKREG